MTSGVTFNLEFHNQSAKVSVKCEQKKSIFKNTKGKHLPPFFWYVLTKERTKTSRERHGVWETWASTPEESEETSQDDSSASGTWVGPFRSAHFWPLFCFLCCLIPSLSLIRHCPRWTDFINIFSLLLSHSSFSSAFFVIFTTSFSTFLVYCILKFWDLLSCVPFS